MRAPHLLRLLAPREREAAHYLTSGAGHLRARKKGRRGGGRCSCVPSASWKVVSVNIWRTWKVVFPQGTQALSVTVPVLRGGGVSIYHALYTCATRLSSHTQSSTNGPTVGRMVCCWPLPPSSGAVACNQHPNRQATDFVAPRRIRITLAHPLPGIHNRSTPPRTSTRRGRGRGWGGRTHRTRRRNGPGTSPTERHRLRTCRRSIRRCALPSRPRTTRRHPRCPSQF